MTDALLFPKEITDVLDTSFMGFKVWHLLIVALLVPSPVAFLVLFLLIPGFKEKATEVIKNGFSGIYSGTAAGNREGPEVSPASDTQGYPAYGRSDRREGESSIGEQLIQKASENFGPATFLSETR